jgi:hypothetical protein
MRLIVISHLANRYDPARLLVVPDYGMRLASHCPLALGRQAAEYFSVGKT